MDMEKALKSILWGRALVRAENAEGEMKTFTLRSLTLEEQNEMEFLKETVLQECEDDGILFEEELKEILEETSAWTSEDDQRIEDLEREVRKCKHGIKQAEFNKTKRRILEKKMSGLELDLESLKSQKYGLFDLTAERRAEEFVRRYIIMKSATDKFGKQIWQTEEDFLSSTDSSLLNNLTLQYMEHHVMSETLLREIARSGSWRFRWSASKNGESLFGKPVAEWTQLQDMLVYWSQYYDFVYESPERPNDMVIENDAALDAWVEEQSRKNDSGSGMSSKAGHQEQFIVVPDADKETIDRVHGMNSKNNRKKISEERKEIKEKGRVSEWELRKKGKA
jgi:hypothetical protein